MTKPTSTEPKHATLAAALVAAQKAAQAVAKSSKNAFHGYKYASAESIVEEAKDALNGAGLALIATGWEVVPSEVPSVESKVVVRYTLVHAGSDNAWYFTAETSIIPEKGRPQDKAEATALTYNLGYFLRGLLQIGREDPSTSVDARDDTAKTPVVTPEETALIATVTAVTDAAGLKAAGQTAKELGLDKNPRVRQAFVTAGTRISGAQ